MINQEIINRSRERLDDTVPDSVGRFLWSDEELCSYLNQVVKDFAKITKIITDSSTPSICTIDLFAGVPIIDISPLIIEINGAHLSSAGFPLGRRLQNWFDRNIINWRIVTGQPRCIIPNYEPHRVRMYPYYGNEYNSTIYAVKGSSDITFVKLGRMILKATGGLSVFSPLTSMLISDTRNNNKLVTVSSNPLNSDISLILEDILIGENNTNALLSKQIDTLNLDVSRLPLTEVTLATLQLPPPEIDSVYHMRLIDGILGYAYQKRDTQTYNLQEAIKYEGKFNDFMQEVEGDIIVSNRDDTTVDIHYGTI